MKKFLITLLTVTLVGAAFIGTMIAQAQNEHSDEYTVISEGIVKRNDVPEELNKPNFKNKGFMALSNEKVIYEKSRLSANNTYADIYLDDAKNEYIYKNGELTGIYNTVSSVPEESSVKISLSEATEIAKNYLSNFISVEDYDIKVADDRENYKQYNFIFARKIGDFYTEDSALIYVLYDGNIKCVSVSDSDEFSDVPEAALASITQQILNDYAESQLSLIYPDKDFSFEIDESSLMKDNNGYYINIYVDLYINGYCKAETLRYDIQK